MAQRSVLITGCSDGGIGSALALAFHARGLKVIATARSVEKMLQLTKTGITTIRLDVTSAASITDCVESVSNLTNGSLDMLVNNAGAGLSMPVTDTPLDAAKDCFDTNFFSCLAVIQAFMPLLLSCAKGGRRSTIVNNTSIVSVIPLPFQAVYNASKAALASLTDTLRLELEPFDIDVVDLKTGAIKSQFFANVRETNRTATSKLEGQEVTNGQASVLPKNSIYTPASALVAEVVSHTELEKVAMAPQVYAEGVVADLLRKSKPPVQIWRGTNATLIWLGRRFLPFTAMDKDMRMMGKLNEISVIMKISSKHL